MFKAFSGSWLGSTRDPLRAALGRLERAVMDTVWAGGDFSVKDVQAALGRPVAYTTVMTTLDRLYKKGLVGRRREGRAFVYTAALERHEIEAAMTAGLLGGVLANGPGAVRPFLSNLVDVVGDSHDELLEELERLVRDKRDTLKRERRDRTRGEPA
jgi:predicted transcriptional regulator